MEKYVEATGKNCKLILPESVHSALCILQSIRQRRPSYIIYGIVTEVQLFQTGEVGQSFGQDHTAFLQQVAVTQVQLFQMGEVGQSFGQDYL